MSLWADKKARFYDLNKSLFFFKYLLIKMCTGHYAKLLNCDM